MNFAAFVFLESSRGNSIAGSKLPSALQVASCQRGGDAANSISLAISMNATFSKENQQRGHRQSRKGIERRKSNLNAEFLHHRLLRLRTSHACEDVGHGVANAMSTLQRNHARKPYCLLVTVSHRTTRGHLNAVVIPSRRFLEVRVSICPWRPPL